MELGGNTEVLPKCSINIFEKVWRRLGCVYFTPEDGVKVELRTPAASRRRKRLPAVGSEGDEGAFDVTDEPAQQPIT